MTGENQDRVESKANRGSSRDSQWRRAAQRHYDPDGDGELATAIVFAIADARGVDPSDVRSPVLYDVVDVAAIEKCFFNRVIKSESLRETGVVEFQYTDYLVRVTHDGWIQIYES